MGSVTDRKKMLQKFKGRLVTALPTPCIVADLEALEANLEKMDGFFSGSTCNLRPHFKSHKCVTLARRQMEFPNTTGITCAKLSEAEQLVAGGIGDVLIANQVIGTDKTDRIAKMNRTAVVRVAVDSQPGIEQLGISALKAGVEIGVLVEVDIGMNRGGVKPGRPVLELAKLITSTDGVRLDGLQSYEGHVVTLPDYGERKSRVKKDMHPLLETRALLEQNGFSVLVSSGGTGTYDITGKLEGIDEMQVGSYALMDAAYKTIRPEFLNARHILATVISKRGDVISTDVGLKGMGTEYGSPAAIGYPDAENLYVAEEHTVFKNLEAQIGDKIRIIPPHGCTTNNFYPYMWISRDDVIIDIWPIEGRGCIE
ncbi:MAG: DSD1 family PLP-dependent enzyme [Bacteroidota bacterium]